MKFVLKKIDSHTFDIGLSCNSINKEYLEVVKFFKEAVKRVVDIPRKEVLLKLPLNHDVSILEAYVVLCYENNIFVEVLIFYSKVTILTSALKAIISYQN